jgi:hypothetical protein
MPEGLRGGSTMRQFNVKLSTFSVYCDAHPEYAREAQPLPEANYKAVDARKEALRGG